MTKIINGKRYDTETAKMVGSTGYGYPNDFNYWQEELYVKRTGEFFLYGEGGPMSEYGISTSDNQFSGSEQIKPLTLEEAQDWGEQYLDADTYEETFGKVEEEKSQIATWVPESVKGDADKLREKGYTLADMFETGVAALRRRKIHKNVHYRDLDVEVRAEEETLFGGTRRQICVYVNGDFDSAYHVKIDDDGDARVSVGAIKKIAGLIPMARSIEFN